jgi:DNA invertase Pin-like site-specific DNA recombinase
MTGQNIGYIRVSASTQNPARQLEFIELHKRFTDVITGSVKDRPQLDACLQYIRDGDTLHIHSIDRLARNLRDLQEIVEGLVANGITVRFHHEQLIFSATNDSPMAKMTLQLMGSFAEFERSMIRARQKEGIAAAVKAGKVLGRPKLDKSLSKKAKSYVEKGFNITQTAKQMDLSRGSIYNLLSYEE